MEAIETYRGHRATRWSAVLRLFFVAGLAVAVAGGLAAALVVLPSEVHDTAGRVWLSIGLFGVTVACIAALLAYSARAFSPAQRRKRRRSGRNAELLAAVERLLDERTAVRAADSAPSAVKYMDRRDAARYAIEWAAHLEQLVEEGDYKQAERDRRTFTLAAVRLAITLRARRILNRPDS